LAADRPHRICYRFLALSVLGHELSRLYRMVYDAERELAAHGIRDLSDQWITAIERPPVA
jgi:hypothetical protein